ncbi:hypothetical protein WME88_32930 [Sorangium sp. So ce216]
MPFCREFAGSSLRRRAASGYDLEVDHIELVPADGGDSGGDSGGTTTPGDGGVVSSTIIVSPAPWS